MDIIQELLNMFFFKSCPNHFLLYVSIVRCTFLIKGLMHHIRSEEVGIYKRKQESKKKRMNIHALDQEADQKKRSRENKVFFLFSFHGRDRVFFLIFFYKFPPLKIRSRRHCRFGAMLLCLSDTCDGPSKWERRMCGS